MIVLSRQVDETVLIGDSISVTVVSIGPEIATLFVRYRDPTQQIEQKLALEVDDRLETTSQVHVYVVAICGDKIRLGVVAPSGFTVHRKERYEAIERTHRLRSMRLGVGTVLMIGESLEVVMREGASGDRELRSRGQLVGGARDGEAFERSDPISVGSTLEFGSLVRVRVLQSAVEFVGLKIEHPVHMICRIQE